MFIIIFTLGTIIGSFLNVCIYRIPRKESIVFCLSHCTNCNKYLKWYELVPILSFIFQRGKCRYCKKSISLQYPFVELANGLFYLILYKHFNFGLNFIFYCIIFSVLIVISFIDYYFYIIPDSLNIILIFSSIIYKTLWYILYDISPAILNNLLGFIISIVLFLTISMVTRGGIGGGDIKLIGVLGFILGIKLVLLNIFLSFVFGAIVSIFLLLFKVKEKRDPISFGPFICISFVIVLLWGDTILKWYFSKIKV